MLLDIYQKTSIQERNEVKCWRRTDTDTEPRKRKRSRRRKKPPHYILSSTFMAILAALQILTRHLVAGLLQDCYEKVPITNDDLAAMHPLVLTLERGERTIFPLGTLGSFTYLDGTDDYGTTCDWQIIIECATTCQHYTTDIPNNFILDITATQIATYDLRFRVFYYSDLADLTKGFTQDFTVEVVPVDCPSFPMVSAYSGAVPWEVWLYDNEQKDLLMPQSHPSVDCSITLSSEFDPDNPPNVVSVSLHDTLYFKVFITALTVDQKVINVYGAYDGFIGSLSLLDIITVEVKSCLQAQIEVNPSTSTNVHIRLVTENEVDMTNWFSVTVPDATYTSRCQLKYWLDGSQPSYVSIPDETLPSMTVEPDASEIGIGFYTFKVRAFYADYDYILDFPSNYVEAEYTFEQRSRCQNGPLDWKSFPSTYSVEVGDELFVEFNEDQPYAGWYASCAIEFISSGDLVSLYSNILTEDQNTAENYYEFLIQPDDYNLAGTTAIHQVTMRYVNFNGAGLEYLEATMVFYINILASTKCNTEYPTIKSVFTSNGLTLVKPLCLFGYETYNPIYTSEVENLCGPITTAFSQTPDYGIFYHYYFGFSPQYQGFNWSPQFRSLLGTYTLVWTPSYANYPDLLGYHENDTVYVQFVQSCQDYPIQTPSGLSTSYSVDVMSLGNIWHIDSFSNNLNCEDDCVIAYELTFTPADTNVQILYDSASGNISIQSTDQNFVGPFKIYNAQLRAYYVDYPSLTSTDAIYTFDVIVVFICLRDSLDQSDPMIVEIEMTGLTYETTQYSLVNFWTNQGVTDTPEDCKLEYSLSQTYSFLSVDSDSKILTLTPANADIGTYDDIYVNVSFQNQFYSFGSYAATILVRVNIFKNCKEVLTITSLPTQIDIHVQSWFQLNFEATSSTIENDPDSCKLELIIDPSSIPTTSTFSNFYSGVFNYGQYNDEIDDSSYSIYVEDWNGNTPGTGTIRLTGTFPNHEGYEAVSPDDQFITVNIWAKCEYENTFTAKNSAYQLLQYTLGSGPSLEIEYEFGLADGHDCYLQNYIDFFIDDEYYWNSPAYSVFTYNYYDDVIVVDTSDSQYVGQQFQIRIEGYLSSQDFIKSNLDRVYTVIIVDSYDPCLYGTFQRSPDEVLPDIEYSIQNNALQTEYLSPFSFNVTTDSACSTVQYQLLTTGLPINLVEFPNGQIEFQVQTQDLTFIGEHTIVLLLTMEDNASNEYVYNEFIARSLTFKLTFSSGCDSATASLIDFNTMPQVYFLGGTQIIIDPDSNTQLLGSNSLVLQSCGPFTVQQVSLEKQTGSLEQANALIVNNEIECCSTSDVRDYGLYDLTYEVKLTDFPNHIASSLTKLIEIVPDCNAYSVQLKSFYSEPFEISAYIGYSDSIEVQDAFTYQFSGHYSSYCGDLVVDLPPSTTASYPYLSISNSGAMIESNPTNIAHRDDDGALTDLIVYLPGYQSLNVGQTFKLKTQVLPWCDLQNLGKSVASQTENAIYEIDNSPVLLIDMAFDVLEFSDDSQEDVCKDERIDHIFFQFEGLAINEAPGFFSIDLSSPTTGIITSSTKGHQGNYFFKVWQETYLPSQTWAYSSYDQEVGLEIIYDPCYGSHIEVEIFQDWDFEWEYEISPQNGENYTQFQLPYYTNDVSRLDSNHYCGPIQYTLGTTDELDLLIADQIDMEPLYVNTVERVVMYAVELKTNNHSVHGQTYELTLSLKMTDSKYPLIPEAEVKISVTVTSACEFTTLKLLNDGDDANFYRRWFSQENSLFFLYQVGDPIEEFQVQLNDTISMQSPFDDEFPFCGGRTFSLEFDAEDTHGATTLSLQEGQDYIPILEFFAEDMQNDQIDQLDVYGVYGNQMLVNENDTKFLVQTVRAYLTVKVDLDFVTDSQTFEINAQIVNSCDRVFLYKEQEAIEMNIAAEGLAKTQTVGPYISYLDYVLYTDFGYIGLQQKSLCGRPDIRISCMIQGQTASSIIGVKDGDISLFTPQFLYGLYSPANYMEQNPEFLEITYNVDGSATVVAEAVENVWEKEPYVCLIDAYLNKQSYIAVPFDFLTVTVQGVDFERESNSPEIRGLDDEYQVIFGSSVEGTFTLIDIDLYDRGELTISFGIVGEEITIDCGCVTFEAQYQTIAGESGTDSSIQGALSKNEKLTEIEVNFIVEPTVDMIGKKYEMSISLADKFETVQKKLVIHTEGGLDSDAEEKAKAEAQALVFQQELIERYEDSQSQLNGGEFGGAQQTQLEDVKNFLTKNAHIFRGGPAPTEKQFVGIKDTLSLVDLAIPFVRSVDQTGIIDVYLSHEILLPNKKQMAAFVRHITYLYAIEIALETGDLVIRGEPQISPLYAEEPLNRTLQSQDEQIGAAQEEQVNFNYLSTWSSYTGHRYNGYSTPNDEDEITLYNSRTFKWEIVDVKEQGIQIQMIFVQPELVSSYGNDVMNFYSILPGEFLNRPKELFEGEQDWGKTRLKDKRNVPKQQPTEVDLEAQAAGQAGLQVISIINLVLASFLQMSLDELWAVFNSLSFVVYLPLFTFIFPDNCQTLMKSLLSVVTFDLIETFESFGIDLIPFEFEETPPFNENFEELGYESSNTLALLGTMNLVIIFMVLTFLLATFIKICTPCQKTRFGKYIREKFPFRDQISTLDQVIITASIELFVCSFLTVIPSQLDLPTLIDQDWGELEGLDQFALAYGIFVLASFTLIVLSFVVITIYMASKIAYLAAIEDSRVFFVSRIVAYKAALRDMQEKRIFVESKIGKKNESQLLEDDEQSHKPQKEVEMISLEQSIMTLSKNNTNDQQQLGVSKFNDFSMMLNNQSQDQILIQLGIQKEAVARPKVVNSKQNLDRKALQAAGQAIEIESDQEKIQAGESQKKTNVGDQQLQLNRTNLSEQQQQASFKYLYKKVINQSEDEMVTRINELVEQKRQADLQGLALKKLTPFQQSLKFYFGGIFDKVDHRNVFNYYYLLIFLFRRIIFVLTAFYLSEYPQLQMMLTYVLCQIMLLILAGSRPHLSAQQNTLETFNENFVLFLLMLAWMMLIIISQVKDPQESLELYNDYGNVFQISLYVCIFGNFFRIIFNICNQYRKKYTAKLRRVASRAAQYDKLMNNEAGHRQCDCKCFTCSQFGITSGIIRHDDINWGPIQPVWFKIRVYEVPYDEDNSWLNFFTTKQESREPQLTSSSSKLTKNQTTTTTAQLDSSIGLGTQQKRSTAISRVMDPYKGKESQIHAYNNDLLDFDLEFQEFIENNRVNNKKAQLEFIESDGEAAQKEPQLKRVRFQEEPNQIGRELNIPIRLKEFDSGTSDEQPNAHFLGEEIEQLSQNMEDYNSVFNPSVDEKMKELKEGDRAGADLEDKSSSLLRLNTKHIRYRKWLRAMENNCIDVQAKNSKQERLRETIEEETQYLMQVKQGLVGDKEDMQQIMAEELQYGEAILERLHSKKPQQQSSV